MDFGIRLKFNDKIYFSEVTRLTWKGKRKDNEAGITRMEVVLNFKHFYPLLLRWFMIYLIF